MTAGTSATPNPWTLETLAAQIDGGVIFAEIAAPPMNLSGASSSATWSPSFSEPRRTTPLECWCSAAPTPTTSSRMSI